MKNILMKCGCAANSLCSNKNDIKYDPPIPSCVFHNCIEVAEYQPDLTKRKAFCFEGFGTKNKHGEVETSLTLPFFEYRPDKKYDIYYCGCRGWD